MPSIRRLPLHLLIVQDWNTVAFRVVVLSRRTLFDIKVLLESMRKSIHGITAKFQAKAEECDQDEDIKAEEEGEVDQREGLERNLVSKLHIYGM